MAMFDYPVRCSDGIKSASLISIIIATRERASQLPQTFDALGKLRIPSGWEAEVLVVDNGSTDNTAEVICNTTLENMVVRYLYEPRKGKSNALNAALARTQGSIILFTDDDVIPAETWVTEIISPLINESCDAVAGRITVSPELTRTWMSPMHRWWLASSDDAAPHEGAQELIGANMAFKRLVLERVPLFDSELGPGGLGLTEDTLFGWQIVEAGFRIGYAPNAEATHRPDHSRLVRTSWLSEARKHGRSEGYVRYHWEHSDIKRPRLRWLYFFMKLLLRRVLQPPPPFASEGCPLWEMSYVLHMEMCKQFCLEHRRARNYKRRGLEKLIFAERPTNKVKLHCAETVT